VRVIWREAARADVELIASHIAEENPLAARRVARALLLAGDSLADFPRRGRPGADPATRELVALWPYIVIYEIRYEAVHILRIWHGAQWRGEV
jgi:plasmid stabilization system protein ParE